jgi:hypothetical protein
MNKNEQMSRQKRREDIVDILENKVIIVISLSSYYNKYITISSMPKTTGNPAPYTF